MKDKRGQISFANILNWFLLVILVGVLSMVLSPMIVEFTANENNTLNKLLIYCIVPFLWIAILITLMQYAQPQQLRPY